MAVKEVTSATFNDAVTQNTKPVLVDFWASWCGPCRALSPTVEKLSNEMGDELDFYKCNVDDEGELASQFSIVSIPTLILFKNGKPVHTMVGLMPKEDLAKEIRANL